jgi:hypothetical protein
MHTRWLFKRVHGVHHRILTPWAITGHYMHPVEFVLTGALALAVPWLIGAHMTTTLIRGGTVVTAEGEFRADVLCVGETVAAVGPGPRSPRRRR